MNMLGAYSIVAGVSLVVYGMVELHLWRQKQHRLRRDVFASLDSQSGEDVTRYCCGRLDDDLAVARWLRTYALPCYTEREMLPHVRAWLRDPYRRKPEQ